MLRCVVAFAFVAATAISQARLSDPTHLVPTRAVRGAVDANTGTLYVMGGRDDRVLDVWRLASGSWQRHVTGPTTGVVSSLAYDSVRNRLVALVTSDAGQTTLMEHDGASWTNVSTAVPADSQLLWHPTQARLLVWIPPFWSPPVSTNTHTLWTWNGTTLTALPMTGLAFLAAPGGRIGYDPVRDRLVVPQGSSLPWVHEWDGTTWTTIVAPTTAGPGTAVFTDPATGHVVFAATVSPMSAQAWTGSAFVPWSVQGMPERSEPLLVGNLVRQVVQLVGGSWPWYLPHGDAWERVGTTWQQVTPETVDPEFTVPQMVAIGTGRALVFDGGYAGSVPARTAIWDNGTWTVMQPATTPPSRSGFALAGDPATGRAFLFGGAGGSSVLADFWMWNGSDWQQLPGGPAGRTDCGLSCRPGTPTVLLYGGQNGVGVANNETWEWNGSSWALRSSSFPPHIGMSSLTWHPQRQRTVLTTFGLLGIEIWEWDGTNWFSTNPPSRPSLQSSLLATYDPVRESILVVDTVSTTPATALGTIHEWHGGTWQSLAPDARLRGAAFAAAGVPGTGLVVLNRNGRVTTTLVHDFPASVASLGTACPDPQRSLAATQPWLGRSYSLRYPAAAGTACLFASGFSATTWLGVPLPFDLGGLGLPGCNLLVAADVLDLRLAGGGGGAELTIALPANPSLAGTQLFHQAAALTTGFTAVSQGVAIVTGSLY